MKRFLIGFLVLLSLGCATTPTKKESASIPAESGIGITIWKIPIVGVGFWGWDRWWGPGVSQVIVHKYDYQARPLALAPGTPPSPPSAGPPPVDYQTIYESAWDDPTLVIFKNDSYRKVKVVIDGQKPIILTSYGATADLHLGMGEHRIRITVEKQTVAHGTWEVVRLMQISIRPENRSQVFHIYE